MKQSALRPQFVEFIPERLIEGNLYISERYSTAVHLCCCGCGEEVVTPLTPADWRIRKEGNNVTLYPSIGNWSFTCQSHYWIRKNKVDWAPAMNQQQIARVQRRDQLDKARHIDQINAKKQLNLISQEAMAVEPRPMEEHLLHLLWRALRKWLRI